MTGGPDFLISLGERLAHQSPLILLYILGIVYAMTRMKRERNTAVLVVVSLSIMLFTSLLTPIASVYFMNEARLPGNGISIYWFPRVVFGLHSISYSVGIAILLYAVFVGRNPAPRSDD